MQRVELFIGAFDYCFRWYAAAVEDEDSMHFLACPPVQPDDAGLGNPTDPVHHAFHLIRIDIDSGSGNDDLLAPPQNAEIAFSIQAAKVTCPEPAIAGKALDGCRFVPVVAGEHVFTLYLDLLVFQPELHTRKRQANRSLHLIFKGVGAHDR